MKLFGIILMIGAGSAMGFCKAYDLKCRTRDIIMLQNAFRLLETDIYYTRSPVPLALETVSCGMPDVMQEFFRQIYQTMEQECMPLYQAWGQAVHYLKMHSSLCEAELDAVRSFGHSLGAGDVQEQLKNFQLLQQRLQYALEQAECCHTQKARIWQYTGICFSIAAVVLMY